MKKTIFASALAMLAYSNAKACADYYYSDGCFFNLFTQSIIRNKAYLPFLRTDDTRFYEGPKAKVIDDNIQLWQKYFGNRFNYDETEYLVNHMPINDLQQYKNGSSANVLLNRIGAYGNFKEGIDYLIEAKYLEPYMRINFVESPDSFYYRENESPQNAMRLNYDRTIEALTNLYSEAKSSEIKARYGYQIVRFNHYTRNYQKAIDAFKTYIEPLKIRTAPYWLALDQMAGAQRGLNRGQEANWNFFQVFSHSNTRKESAFVSMKLSDSASFNNIMKRAQMPEEKNMAYFLLGYDEYANPLPMMEKMYDVDPNSDILKVMAARSINELERNYLPIYYSTERSDDASFGNKATPTEKTKAETKTEEKKESFWDKIVGFFKNLFSSEKPQSEAPKTSEEKAQQSDKDLLENPNRIPFFSNEANPTTDDKTKDYSEELLNFIEKTKEKSNDEFWAIAQAYMKFLKKDYKGSSEVLNAIKTGNAEYIDQMNRLKMLNDITAQPKIDAAFEDHIMKAYPNLFAEKPKTDTVNYVYETPGTNDFIRDVLANRYFLQGEYGKSFLMSNKMSDLQYSPNSVLVKKVEEYYRKPNKTSFETAVVNKNMDDVGDPNAFFNLIYGDNEMRSGNFSAAKAFYTKVQNFKGLPRYGEMYDEKTQSYLPFAYKPGMYNGFDNISSLVFGHNVWESFQSDESQSMVAENFTGDFPFITNKMNKLQLADALIRLKEMASGKEAKAAQANQLIGNLLYNTSVLGFYRELFVLDIDNSNGGKYDFGARPTESPYRVYYKDFYSHTFIKPDNFDLSLNYYQKALHLTSDRENKARILFQMASAEQGKYYQWASTQEGIDYSDPQWDQKERDFQNRLAQNKNAKFRTFFTALKSQYADTQTAQGLMGSCSYFNYFMKKK